MPINTGCDDKYDIEILNSESGLEFVDFPDKQAIDIDKSMEVLDDYNPKVEKSLVLLFIGIRLYIVAEAQTAIWFFTYHGKF